MIAPVAAPHAAPCPTGVSHELRMQQLTATTELIVRIVVRIICILVCDIKLREPARCCGSRLKSAFIWPNRYQGYTNTFFARTSRTNPPWLIFEQLYF